MFTTVAERLAKEHKLTIKQAEQTLALFDEGATIPFVARYRKEATGGLDEVILVALRDGAERLRALDKRRDAIKEALAEREQLTPELSNALDKATSLTSLEDIYLPYRPKRVTRASKAREKGLAPLATALLAQKGIPPERLAASYINPAKGVVDIATALAGARDIIAETVAEDSVSRSTLRGLFVRKGTLSSKVVKGKEEEGATYQDHFNRQEHAAAMPAHRILAMFRGEREGFLSLSIRPDALLAESSLQHRWIPTTQPESSEIATALHDAWLRLLAPSLENEYRTTLRERAEHDAIAIFATNLRKLLLAPPLGAKRVMALDPGWRTGAKLVCLDASGSLLHSEVIFPLTGGTRAEQASATVITLCKKYNIEAIAIGNGTAGRETEAFIRSLGLASHIAIILVDERGASVYSASEVARAEFPDQDITVRGAVSIGRRLMDPLAELVKVEPASLGVGQYQHDVNQKALQHALEDVVSSCVNGVGVDVNTASPQLLSYVSGINKTLAQSIVDYRAEHGAFTTRKQLLSVPRLGKKAFELAAGFLRIHNGAEPLDNSAVHPERYGLVQRMAKDVGCSVQKLLQDETLRKRIAIENYVDSSTGLPTLRDIMNELAKPGRDPRQPFEAFQFTEGVTRIEDISVGMELAGIITNVTQFGAFVDLGVHRDGLIHISQLADRFISNPADVVSTGMKVTVRVLDVEYKRERINLSLKGVSQST